MRTYKWFLAAVTAAVMLACAGCSPAQKHPNQINTFDGATYDSMTAAHAALASFRTTVATKYPQYTTTFNQAAAAYAVAFDAYSAFRTTPANTTSVTVAISNLTVAIIALENALQNDMKVPPQTVSNIRSRAVRLRSSAQSAISISDILSELEVAAAIASTIPGTQPYSTLAALVIQATQQAVAALQSASGQPIDLSTLTPIAAL